MGYGGGLGDTRPPGAKTRRDAARGELERLARVRAQMTPRRVNAARDTEEDLPMTTFRYELIAAIQELWLEDPGPTGGKGD